MRGRLPLGLFFLLVFGAVGVAGAADRFVSTDGSDLANDCLGQAAPCRTPQHALTQAASGDTVKIAAGKYGGPLVIAPAPSVMLVLQGGWTDDFATRDVVGNKTALKGAADEYAVHVSAGNGEVIDLTLDGITFEGAKGGAIEATTGGDGALTLTVTSCTFRGNKALAAGGIYAAADQFGVGNLQVVVLDSTFRTNLGKFGPGAILVSARSGASTVGLTILRSRFIKNRARGSGGGAIVADLGTGSANVTVIDSSFYKNQSASVGAGAILVDGPSDGDPSQVTLTNSVFVGNRTSVWAGGALRFDAHRASLAVTSCTITKNAAPQFGGGLYVIRAQHVSFANSILWGNSALFGGDFHVSNADGLTLDHNDLGIWVVSNLFVDNRGGNIYAIPGLAPAQQVLHLAAGSPCIDAGTCVGTPVTDLEGDPRPSGGDCDIGADEFVP